MKNLVLFLALSLTLTAAPALASTFGPAKPLAEPGRFSLGVGIFHFTGNLEFDDGNKGLTDEEIDQTRFFVQGSLGLSENSEIYARLGGSDLEYEGGFLGEETFDADAAPFASLGFKGPIHAGRGFDLGFFVEGTYYGDYEEEMTFGSTKVEIEFDPSWEADLGLTFQKEIEGAYLYGGPVLYYRDGDANITANTTPALDESDSYNEEGFIGAFLGAHWAMKNGVRIELEAQFKSEASFGGAVSYSFR